MTHAINSNGREAAYLGVPWEDSYGYPQAVRVGDIIYVSGQLSHDTDGNVIAPAALGADGRPIDFSTMEEQMRTAYENAATVLAQFGATLGDVVDETLFVIDMDAAFAVTGKVRKAAYGTERPRCASNIIGVNRLVRPDWLIEIAFKAVIGRT